MVLSAVVNVLNTIVLGFLFGFDLNQEIAEMQTMMNSIFEQAGVALPGECAVGELFKADDGDFHDSLWNAAGLYCV